ncbi:MAG: glycoside hydrolase family 16 protein, partial [Planctomycetales bacterium]|nr:glycoside hydrolase family 16 protein [Planctomycetales bacterium]
MRESSSVRIARLLLIACLAGRGVVSATVAAAATPGWTPVWNDEFDSLDTSKWTLVNTNKTTNNSQQDYLPQQIAVNDGMLTITSENVASRGLPYRSGQVISKLERQYGRWEVRAKLPTSKGMWPAIWLLPDVTKYNWPSQGEIDIMENRGDQPTLTSSAFHYGSNPPYQHHFVFSEQQSADDGVLDDYHQSFHTYAVEWDATKLRFFVDDVHYYTVVNSQVRNFLSNQSAPMQLVINTAIGGDFLANPDASTVWPQQMQVDYVRVFERDAAPPPKVFFNGDFEENEGSLAQWTVFGRTSSGNVQTHHEAVASGEHSLKLFGQFTNQVNYSGVEQGISVAAGDVIRATVDAMIRAADALAGDNRVEMKFDYYNESGGLFASSAYIANESQSLLVADAQSPTDQWLTRELVDVVADGAVVARLALVFTQPAMDAGAVHIDNVHFT